MRTLKKYIKNPTAKLFTCLVIGTAFLTNCVQKDDLLGTEIKSPQSGFKVEKFEISTNRDFTQEEGIDFDMKFNQDVTSVLTITSLTSGAVKKMTSSGQELTQKWRGGHNGLQFFNTGDTCSVELSFYGSDTIRKKTIVINKAFDFKTDDVLNVFPNNFDDAAKAGWWFSAVKQAINPEVKPIQGADYLYLKGTSSSASVYVGGGSFGAWGSSPLRMISGDTVSVESDQMWFNVYAYGTGDTETELYITLYEDDGNQGQAKNTDDGIQVKLTFEHQGWKLLSFKYADIPFKTYNATTGNNIREPHRIVLWDIGLQVKTAGNSASAIIDFPIMTIGGPFDPSKY